MAREPKYVVSTENKGDRVKEKKPYAILVKFTTDHIIFNRDINSKRITSKSKCATHYDV